MAFLKEALAREGAIPIDIIIVVEDWQCAPWFDQIIRYRLVSCQGFYGCYPYRAA